jgi:hypothetical protein
MKKEDHILSVAIKYPELTQQECRKLNIFYEGRFSEEPECQGTNKVGKNHMRLLEKTFACFNGGSDMECDTFIRAGVRSMMVGDFVCIEAQWYECMTSGWKKVTWEDVYGEEAETRKSIDNFLKVLEEE